MRFAHISDTHMGIRQYNIDEREEDFYGAFHESVDKIIERGCDFVIHSGDLFDEPRPQVKAMVDAALGFKELARLDEVKIVTKKPVRPSDEEAENNPRSRSAKLRVAEKL